MADYQSKRWTSLLADARDAVCRSGVGRIEGSDVSPEAIRGASRNSAMAGVSDIVSFRVCSISDFSPPEPRGILLCNPPYGVRMAGGEEEIAAFYTAMGEALKKRCRGWTAYLLSGNADATRHIRLKASRRYPLMNGPIDCRLLKYELY
jgi:putative N6-adenine-specific DNA methylase